MVESDVPLSQWNWYNHEYGLVGTGMVWGADGWVAHDTGHGQSYDPAAKPFEGSYYYRIELDNATVPHNLLAFLGSQGEPATVKFYATTTH